MLLLRRFNPELANRFSLAIVLMHRCVLGELACGTFKNREAALSHLSALPSMELATDAEVLHLIEHKRLWARGIGWVDIHLMASALLSHCRFWTFDKRLAAAAGELGLAS